MTTPHLKLTYFDFDGGRGEPARLALHLGGIKFDDDRVPVEVFGAERARFPFLAVPVLEVDGQVVSQSNSICRYIGRLAGLYPDDPWQALLCDEVMDASEDMQGRIVATFSIKDDAAKKHAREALIDSHLRRYLTQFASMLEQRGGSYFADDRLTVADLKVFVWVRSLRSGKLDHVPADLVDTVAPALVAHLERINDEPGVRDYYASR